MTIAESGTSELDHYAKLEELEARFKQLDRHLAAGIETLLRVAELTRSKDPDGQIPAWISESRGEPESFPLSHAIVCATLQKISRQQRRYPDVDSKRLEKLLEWLPRPFLDTSADASSLAYVQSLRSRAFGALNPLTASQVLRVLLQTGETATISPLGTLAVFSILWALHRRHGENRAAGAALDPWRPTAAITAKCVFVLESLRKNCAHRAIVLEQIRTALIQAEALQEKKARFTGVRDRWLLCHTADRIATELYELAEMSAGRKETAAAAKQVSDSVAALKSTSTPAEYSTAYAIIREQITQVLEAWRTTVQVSLDTAAPVVERLIPKIKAAVKSRKPRKDYFPQLQTRSPAVRDDQITALTHAREDCEAIRRNLRQSAESKVGEPLSDALRRAAKGYKEIARHIEDALQPAIRWCQIVVRDQIAHASAGNYTDFDPAELMSAIAVSRMSEAFSMLESRDAIVKSMMGVRADGSWSRGQPIYLHDRVLGVWPSTPDIVWALCTALSRTEGVDATEVLNSFVHWAERNRTKVNHHEDDTQAVLLHGWSTELYRDEQTVDVWTTAVTVNVLMEIRQILESTAHEMCRRRFTVIPVTRSLEQIDPVDLGAVHGKRLHRTLAMAIGLARRGDEAAPYSFVFHGPPGSSKTALANALAMEMWDGARSEGFLIRITPADFTRLGGDRLDSEARFIFGLLARTRRVTILFDEIDDLLRVRTPEKPTFFDLVVPAMLNRLQDLRDAAPRQEICFVLSTNYVERIEPALIRTGRVDRAIPVPYPDAFSRVAIFERVFEKRGAKVSVSVAAVKALIERAAGQPWAEVARAAEHDDVASLFNESRRLNDVNRYYQVRERWEPLSEPLLNELLHVVASRSMKQDVNRKTLEDFIIGEIPTVKLQDQFKDLCIKEGR